LFQKKFYVNKIKHIKFCRDLFVLARKVFVSFKINWIYFLQKNLMFSRTFVLFRSFNCSFCLSFTVSLLGAGAWSTILLITKDKNCNWNFWINRKCVKTLKNSVKKVYSSNYENKTQKNFILRQEYSKNHIIDIGSSKNS